MDDLGLAHGIVCRGTGAGTGTPTGAGTGTAIAGGGGNVGTSHAPSSLPALHMGPSSPAPPRTPAACELILEAETVAQFNQTIIREAEVRAEAGNARVVLTCLPAHRARGFPWTARRRRRLRGRRAQLAGRASWRGKGTEREEQRKEEIDLEWSSNLRPATATVTVTANGVKPRPEPKGKRVNGPGLATTRPYLIIGPVRTDDIVIPVWSHSPYPKKKTKRK
jgi:hypothetical protein